MSPSPNGPDHGLRRLRDEGYRLVPDRGELLVMDVPFVGADRRVGSGTLVLPMPSIAGEVLPPRWHHAGFRGGTPHAADGTRLGFVAALARQELSTRRWDSAMCLMPVGREFDDYHEMVTTYCAMIVGEAQRIDPTATARTGRGLTEEEGGGPFAYHDTGAVRNGTVALGERLAAGGPVGIVGVGGTGSYVLDLVAKTPVPAIHLFDDDAFRQHNAFRAPGAATPDDLRAERSKVDHFAAVYSAMHRGVVPHRVRVDGGAARKLALCGFVFVCVDDAATCERIVRLLDGLGVPWIDVGMGLRFDDDGVAGIVRVGCSDAWRADPTPGASDGSTRPAPDAYRSNVQVADLNALNAALAVIAWKRRAGFYAGASAEAAAVYVVESGRLITEVGEGERS